MVDFSEPRLVKESFDLKDLEGFSPSDFFEKMGFSDMSSARSLLEARCNAPTPMFVPIKILLKFFFASLARMPAEVLALIRLADMDNLKRRTMPWWVEMNRTSGGASARREPVRHKVWMSFSGWCTTVELTTSAFTLAKIFPVVLNASAPIGSLFAPGTVAPTDPRRRSTDPDRIEAV